MNNSLLSNSLAHHVALSWSDELLVGYPYSSLATEPCSRL